MKQIHAAHGNCGRAAYVLEYDEPGEQGYIIKFSSMNGMLRMWEPRVVTISDSGSKMAARADAKTLVDEFVEGSPTNIEKVGYLMNWSDAGPLIQAFVLQGIERYADAVIDGGAKACDTPLISGAAWVRCAVDAKAKLGG